MTSSTRLMVVASAIIWSLSTFALNPSPAAAKLDPRARRIYAVIVSVDLTKNTLTVRRRNGLQEVVDISMAASQDQLGVLPINRGVVLYGSRSSNGVFHVQSIGHAAPSANAWGNDNT